MKTQLPPESLESRIAPAAVSGLAGEDFAGPTAAAAAFEQPVEAPAPPVLTEPGEGVMLPRSGNTDLGTIFPDVPTVPVEEMNLRELSGAASDAVQGIAVNVSSLATSALGGEPTGIGTLGIGAGGDASAGIDATSPLESGAASIADLVLVRTGGFAGANPESLLIVKV